MNALRRLFSADRTNTGAALGAALLLVALSQPRTYQFLMNTYMGRFLLAIVVASMAYVHIYLGAIAVLLVVLSVNYHETDPVKGYNYYQYEGFSGEMDVSDVSGNKPSKPVPPTQIQPSAQPNEETKALIQETTRATLEEKGVNPDNASNTAREGFCLSDKESNILRGKQSHSVPIFNKRTQPDTISPSNGSVFDQHYAPF